MYGGLLPEKQGLLRSTVHGYSAFILLLKKSYRNIKKTDPASVIHKQKKSCIG